MSVRGNAAVLLTARVVVLCATAALIASGCRGGAMTPYRFAKDAESLASLATDGALLADGVADDRITAAFVRAHAEELAADCEKLASVVASTEPEPQLSEKTAKLAALARRVSAQLRSLADHAGDRAAAATLKSALADAADAASNLEESV